MEKEVRQVKNEIYVGEELVIARYDLLPSFIQIDVQNWVLTANKVEEPAEV